MAKFQSVKKICKFVNVSISNTCIDNFVSIYKTRFRSYRFDNTPVATNYLKGLLSCPKGEANMEKMEEQVAQDVSKVLNQQKKLNHLPVGYIVDESAHLKKGKKSVGVSRQYAGVIGKVNNCQVGVYSSLVNGTSASIINERIFLPETWTKDVERYKGYC